MRYHVVGALAVGLVGLLGLVSGCGGDDGGQPVDAAVIDSGPADAFDCDAGGCPEPTCTDGIENGTETDLDCGGDCAPGRRCGDGLGCAIPGDCQSGVCTGQVCQAPACGDGVRQGDEACDDGNQTNGDGCDDGTGGNCRPTGCGNGVRAGSEQCDDGNSTQGDGCDNNCTNTGCGNGVITSGEVCDDDDTDAGDGCGATCQIEPGFTCSMTPSVCVGMCGDGVVVAAEQCDDAPPAENGDGCSMTCMREPGYTCTGSPSVCTTMCGDGVRAGAEGCDDAPPAESGDGCNASCFVEPGWVCVGTPSLCFPICGDGRVVGTEACDDPVPAENGDGCSASCTVESGYMCSGSPSTCTPVCGDGMRIGAEMCDDMPPAENGDGCSATCAVEPGWTCMGNMPSTCVTTCGDGIRAGAEECDDTAPAENGDGCSATCTVESGYTCTGTAPSTCSTVCGDGLVRPGEACDDPAPAEDGDGCSALCTVETGYVCSGEPSNCQLTCGDGDIDPGETCDDAPPAENGDGCNAACQIELGYNCTGTPSICTSTCGDGVKASNEACDDAPPAENGDGCSALCTIDPGYTCTGTMPSVCNTTCGDGVTAGTEQCDDGCGPATPGVCDAGDNGDGCTSTCTLECGDGTLDPAIEQCDDGNRAAGDGCSPTCAFEVTCGATETLVSLRPMDLPKTINDDVGINIVTSTVTGAPAGTVRKAYVGIGRLVHDFDADLDISLLSPTSVRVDLTSDNGSSGINYIGTLFDDAATTSVTAGAAPFRGRFRPEQALSRVNEPANGTWTFEVIDDFNDTGTAHGTLEAWTLLLCVDTTVICGDGAVGSGEECDDTNRNNGDGCSSTCKLEDGCGDGNIDAGEVCDDDNLVSGDGCSATCAVDITCGAGETAVVLSDQASQAIADDNLFHDYLQTVALTGGVQRASVFLTNIAHANTGHLDIQLVSPGGVIRDLSSDNGSTANYVQTAFDDAATTAITAGTVPFTGRFRPEQSLTSQPTNDFRNVNANGSWRLQIRDDTAGTAGTLNGWTLALCVSPASYCGDAVPNLATGEECDDGNTVDNDACSNLCALTDGCGDGNLDLGEECDDNNIVNGDGCSSLCVLDIACGAGEMPVIIRNTTVTTIPDNTAAGTLSSPIVVPVSGVVRRVIPSVGITHTQDGDVDLWLMSPFGVQRNLTDDNGAANDNYASTSFSDSAFTSITTGTAPYTGTFLPEQSISNPAGFGNQSAGGNWYLRVADDGTAGQTGTLDRWSLALCVDTSVASVCGNGFVEAAEQCDDGNAVAGDGCTSCQIDLTCTAGQTRVILRASPELVIPDTNATGITSFITVAQTGTVRKAIVELATITHTFDGDLDVTFSSPMGTNLDITSDNGGGDDDYISTLLDDAGAAVIPSASGNGPYRGRFRPETAFSGVNGQAANGVWSLKVADDAGGDTGVLRSWVLGLCVE